MPIPCGEELTIHDLLSDPLILAVMRADRVDPLALRRMLGTVAIEVQRPERQSDHQPHWYRTSVARAADWARSHSCGAC